jgi:MYXO-CTERM domain-containing protein
MGARTRQQLESASGREKDPEMKTLAIAVVGTASLVASADAGFAGFVASVRNSGAYTVIDIFASVTNASDKFLNVYNTTSNGTFYQAAGLTNKTWKPDAAGFTSTRNSIDSFMTAGTFSGGAYGGEYYASTNTNGDPNFTGTSWSPTPASAAATTIPALAGWYTGDPTSVDNNAESLAGLVGRVNGTYVGIGPAAYGIWCSHLVILGNNKVIGTDFTFSAFASIKDGVTGQTSQASSSFQAIPAPGALALLGVAGVASSRRRRA